MGRKKTVEAVPLNDEEKAAFEALRKAASPSKSAMIKSAIEQWPLASNPEIVAQLKANRPDLDISPNYVSLVRSKMKNKDGVKPNRTQDSEFIAELRKLKWQLGEQLFQNLIDRL